MLREIRSKSLITGKVKIDESRKEIKNRPGAPKVPANATILCFQTVKDEGNARPPRNRVSVYQTA